MSSLKTLLMVLLLVPGQGLAAGHPLVSAFASCAGRFSAELEHAWLTHDASASAHAHRREVFIELLRATVPMGERANALNLRINAKLAHAGLLSQATFSSDAERAAWALRRAEDEIAYCEGFLLES